MKRGLIVLFLVLGFSLTQSFAQRDQITTQAGEKIRCRILDETPSRFIYAYLSPKGKVLRNEIFKNLVTEFKYNFYESDIITKGNKLPGGVAKEEVPVTTNPKADTPKVEESNNATENKNKSRKSKRAEQKATSPEKNEVANNAKEEVISKDNPSEKTTQPDNKKDRAVSKNKEEKKSIKEADTKKATQSDGKKDGVVSDNKDEKKVIKETDTKRVAQPEEKKDGIASDSKEEKKVVKETDTKKVIQPEDKKDELASATQEEKKTPKEKTPKKVTQVADTKKKNEVASTSTEEKKPKKEKIKTQAPLATKKEKNEFDNYLKYRLGVRGGFGNMLTKLDTKDAFGLYQEKLLRGWTWGADAAFFPTDVFGFGIMFNNFQSKNSAENIKYHKFKIDSLSNEEVTGNISNKRSTKFVGPVFYFRKNIDYKTMVILGLAPGAYFYTDKGTYDNAQYTYKGMDFGAAATLGIDFLLGNDISGRDIILSLEAGYNYGKMRALNLGDGQGAKNLSTPLDLSRVDFTVGLRFTRYPKYLRN